MGVVVVDSGVVGTVVFEQSAAISGDESAAGSVAALGVVVAVEAPVVAEVLELELVWPSMRCSTGNVDDN